MPTLPPKPPHLCLSGRQADHTIGANGCQRAQGPLRRAPDADACPQGRPQPIENSKRTTDNGKPAILIAFGCDRLSVVSLTFEYPGSPPARLDVAGDLD